MRHVTNSGISCWHEPTPTPSALLARRSPDSSWRGIGPESPPDARSILNFYINNTIIKETVAQFRINTYFGIGFEFQEREILIYSYGFLIVFLILVIFNFHPWLINNIYKGFIYLNTINWEFL